jgi:hypothetical protein
MDLNSSFGNKAISGLYLVWTFLLNVSSHKIIPLALAKSGILANKVAQYLFLTAYQILSRYRKCRNSAIEQCDTVFLNVKYSHAEPSIRICDCSVKIVPHDTYTHTYTSVIRVVCPMSSNKIQILFCDLTWSFPAARRITRSREFPCYDEAGLQQWNGSYIGSFL